LRQIAVEVGERREPDGQLNEGPNLTVSRSEGDGMAERHGSYTVLRPGKRKASIEAYQRLR
jgi:hypothetical protein